MELELERGHDPEIAATAPHRRIYPERRGKRERLRFLIEISWHGSACRAHLSTLQVSEQLDDLIEKADDKCLLQSLLQL
jgi:hypothetical protein